jgi:DNA-binding MarR family transcriptional regulator
VFEDLWSQSNGNPLLGQLLWLSALERKNERTLAIEHIKAQPRHMTRSCQVDQQHILAALIRHRSMSVEELHQVLRLSRSAIQRELNHLMRLGLVRLHLDLADRFEVSSLFSMTLEHELREENVL